MLSELDALIILTTIPHLGPVKIRALVQLFGSALAALDTDPKAIAKLPDFGPKILEGWNLWRCNTSWKRNVEQAEKHQAEIIPYTSPKFPKRLLEINDCPVLLYVKGKIQPADQYSIAVIGTRQASIYGCEMADKISSELAAAGFNVVSGLARGIDTAAHKGALRKGRTTAVIGSGLADIYPQENADLAASIASKGALISEFPMNMPPDRQNFPQRNRIVAAMTMATLLIEAPIKSGAMITMDRALTYKRKLFALPGRVDTQDFRGNHFLIKNGHAQLVEGADDIIHCFNDLFKRYPEPTLKPKLGNILNPEERDFLSLLPDHEVTIEEIMSFTNLPVMKINVIIMGLLLKKMVKEFPGKIYKKIITG